MARGPRKRGKAADPAATSRGASMQQALDPLSALLKGAGLRRSAPEADTPKSKPKSKAAKKAAAKRRTANATRSPLAVPFPNMPTVPGVRLGAVAAGIKYRGRRDLMVATLASGTTVAGVFTQSKTAAAPVEWCRKGLDREDPAAGILVVNSGNANAFTGKAGQDATKEIAGTVAKAAGCRRRDVFICSTGVIGEPLPVEKITARLPSLVRGAGPRAWGAAAKAIMTTDTFPKGATRTAKIDGVEVKINGIAKGSGMIAPDLATMLAFIYTDAQIPSDVLQSLLLLGTRDSFNSITVDSDTSTSDTVLCFATGQAKLERPITRAGDRRLSDFRRKLFDLMLDLALQIVRDGEGATKLVRVAVSGAASTSAARKIALSIANSPLVKTAVAGEDPNWGRIVMAVGKSGEAADRDKLKIALNGILVAAKGHVDPDYVEADGAAAMKAAEITIEVDVGVGRGTSTIWTCDLTHRYISINADYRS